VSERAHELETQGFTVLPDRLPPGALARLIARLDALREDADASMLYAEDDLVVAADVKVSPVGLTFFGLLGRAPEMAELILRADLVALLQEVLGTELELEQGSAVISDHTRPFFFWHEHVGGIDGEDFRQDRRTAQAKARIERLVCTIYGTPLDAHHGAMLVYPRKVGDPLLPPHAPGRSPWPGAVQLSAPEGSIVVLDEATWHAVTPMSGPGVRRFVAFFVRRAGLPPNRRVDETIGPAVEADARLARVFQPARAVEGAARGRG